jgi:periplasmic protein CpxP/Spy
MNTHNDTSTNEASTTAPRSRRFWKIAAGLALTAAIAGSGIAAAGQALHGHRGHMAMSPAAMDAHIDKMVELCGAGASADQKSRLSVIAKTAVNDVRPAHEELRQGHVRLHQLLSAPTIDRAALEQLRAAQVQRMDAISRRMLTAVEEGADVLTPDQRQQCISHLGALMH